MRHKFLVLTVKKLLKSVYIYRSYRKIKTGLSLFLDHSVYWYIHLLNVHISVKTLHVNLLFEDLFYSLNYIVVYFIRAWCCEARVCTFVW